VQYRLGACVSPLTLLATMANTIGSRPFVAGISGDSQLGAYSVALSGGYDDDVDMGYGL
jgi:hypothetical protein